MRSKWFKASWKTQEGREMAYHYLWRSSVQPEDRDLREILDKQMGGRKRGHKVVMTGNSAEEFKEKDGQEMGREWFIDVKKESRTGYYEVVTTVGDWHKVSKDFVDDPAPKEEDATSCPWLKGPHDKSAKEPLCQNGVFSWKCNEGGHGMRMQCPKGFPHMCDEVACGGGKDHCCEPKAELCKKGPRKCPQGGDTGGVKTWEIKRSQRPSHDEALDLIYETIGDTANDLIETESGDGVEEKQTEGGQTMHRIWRFRVEQKTAAEYVIIIFRTAWSKALWAESKGNVQVFHYEWAGTKKPCDKDLRKILDKEMGKAKSDHKVIIETSGAHEHKTKDGQHFVRDWNMDVKKENQGNGQFIWEVVTEKTEWKVVEGGFQVEHKEVSASSCPWLDGPHKHSAKEPLCSEGVFSWECHAGGHGERIQCPADLPVMCEDKRCGGSSKIDHCCEPNESYCKQGPRKCHTEAPTTTTTTTASADCGRIQGESFQAAPSGIKCKGGKMTPLGQANMDQCERKCEQLKKAGCCAHSAMFDGCTFFEGGDASGSGAQFDKAIMCTAR